MSSIDSAVSSLISAQQGAVRSAIGYTLAAKQLDVQEQQGQAAVSLLEAAVQLSKEPGKGGNVDTLA